MKYILLVIVTTFSVSVMAGNAGTVSGYIYATTVKESGYILVQYKDPHANPNECVHEKMVAISPTHSMQKEMYSMVLAAQMSQKKIHFYTSGCYEAYGSSYSVAITSGLVEE